MAATIQVKRNTNTDEGALGIGEFGFHDVDPWGVFIGATAGNKQIDYPAVDKAKLLAIEELADVTDDANVRAALAAATADIAVNSQKITGLADPASAQDAATKAYADSLANGLDVKASVRAATTVDGALATAYADGQVIDGVTLATGDRILLQDQTDGSENGIYTVNASGAPTRATDADVDAEVTAGLFTFVEEGTANADKGFVLTTNDPITVDTTVLVFSLFSSVGAATAFVDLTDTPANYTAAALKIARVNTGADAIEFVAFAATYLDDSAGGTDAETGKAPTSNVMYDHGIATTGVHGAGANTLLHSASTIDGGTWAA